MLTHRTRLHLQGLLQRLARGDELSLRDRIELQKYADHNPTVAGWLRQARRCQLQGVPAGGLDRLLHDLGLGEAEPGSAFDPRHDDLGDWFSGSPGWLRRS